MAKMELGENVQKYVREGGVGGGAQDVSDDMAKMTNYERAICNLTKQPGGKTLWEMFGQLLVFEKGKTDPKKYKYTILEPSDIPDMTAKSVGAAGHAINGEFAAMRVPLRAVPFSSEDAPVDAEGKKQTDCLKIYRTGVEFNPSLYAIRGGEEGSVYHGFGLRVATKGKNVGQVLKYEDFTVGQKLRADKWLAEVAAEEVDPAILEDLGIHIEEVEEEPEEESEEEIEHVPEK